mmetsp:Transcript_33351/g.81963  ORF Transcript_33351/g.81963 Transcript_33351/m.81963 type:complete len:232 (+) Transcript_33351:269-964(+)
MGGQADILRPPGRTAINYRSDSLTFKTVKVPEQSVAAKAAVVDTMGADPLQLRPLGWARTTYVEQNKHLRPKAVAGLLSTTHGPDGPSAANHAAVEAAVLKMETTVSIAFGKLGTTGDWASSTALEPRQMRDSLEATRAVSLRHTAAATPRLLSTMSTKAPGGGEYKPPWAVQEEATAAMRALKASGQWPAPPPKPQVLACTVRSKTHPRDLQDVLDLDTFHLPGGDQEGQ